MSYCCLQCSNVFVAVNTHKLVFAQSKHVVIHGFFLVGHSQPVAGSNFLFSLESRGLACIVPLSITGSTAACTAAFDCTTNIDC